MKKLLSIFIIAVLLLVGCSETDPIREDVYIESNLYVWDGDSWELVNTGLAELDTLTDNSMTDALHRHSELSASDGSPDAVVSVDADGVLYADGSPDGLDVLYSAEIGAHLIVGNNITVGGTVDGRDLSVDGTKLDTIATNADVATKEFFVPVNRADDMNQTVALPGAYIDAAGERAWIAFHIPHDFNSITEAVVLINPLATATHRFDITSNYAAVGEAFDTHSGSDLNHDFSMTALQFYEIDVSGVLSSLSAGDYGGIKLLGDATNTPNALVIGFRLKYTD